ncbi:MAG: ATP-binding cassette domain-containing protein [Salinivirgaceae bacterium]|jgi:ATP-binding cassette subfamily F protein 3|nr:ABC-F family ATP-binding cassette domain-containing protein [Bacteroidales bacterium]
MISVNQLTLRFGDFTLFENISFLINERDRIGLVGRNGIGKSTLMKILNKEMKYDEGSLAFPNECTVGYLPQHLDFSDQLNVIEETSTAFHEVNLLEEQIEKITTEVANRTDYESESYLELINKLAEYTDRYHILGGDKRTALIEQTLKGLGFLSSDFERPTNEFSGGWRMRIELAKLILQKPDLLMLDEPTNHLDIEAIEWLESFLKDYPGAVLIISHDRRFLDSLTNRTIEIANKRIYDYPVPYSKYVDLMEERMESQQAAYDNQQKKIKETQEFIDRFRYKATKAVQVQSRIKSLEKMEIVEVDSFDQATMNIKFPPSPRSGDVVVEAENISVSYGSLQVLDNVGITIERGEKISFVGRNGEGKTTMVKAILKEVETSGGYLKIGHNVKTGYFAQHQNELLDPEKTVFQTIDDIATGEMRTKTRDILGAFLFSGEDVDKPVKVLSGGEKARLALSCMLLEPINLLILDEPTHHLDMISKNILKQALLQYDGTLIIVSHDRDFLDGLTDKVYEFRNKKVHEHRGGIETFLEKRRLERLQDLNTNAKLQLFQEQKKENENRSANKILFNQQKEYDREIRKVQNQIERIENEIHTLEYELEALQEVLSNPENITNEEPFLQYSAIQKKLEKLSSTWLELSEEAERLSILKLEDRRQMYK